MQPSGNLVKFPIFMENNEILGKYNKISFKIA